MKIRNSHKEEKPSESLRNNLTRSSVLSPQSSERQSSALSTCRFETICSQLLKEGKSVRFEAPGKSMYPVILDGETLIVEPVAPSAVKIGDIILYKSEKKLIAHRVISIKKFSPPNAQPPTPNRLHKNTQSSVLSPQSSRAGSPAISTQYSFILRGDAAYSYDEPIYADQILGRVIALERAGRRIDPYSFRHKLSCRVRIWKSRLKRIFF